MVVVIGGALLLALTPKLTNTESICNSEGNGPDRIEELKVFFEANNIKTEKV